MTEKKFILFLVEGPNDETELQAILHAYCPKLFELYTPHFHVLQDTDISANWNYSEKNVRGKINDIVIRWRQEGIPFSRIQTSDIARIVHVMDMDGAFVPDSAVVTVGFGKPVYEDTQIKCANRETILQRNHRKVKILNKLITISNIDNIPYSVWFASCNMDHLLFNERNSTALQKKNNGRDFAFRVRSNPDILKESVFADDIASKDYSESWVFLSKEYNSLQRHTNLNLLFDELNIQ